MTLVIQHGKLVYRRSLIERGEFTMDGFWSFWIPGGD